MILFRVILLLLVYLVGYEVGRYQETMAFVKAKKSDINKQLKDWEKIYGKHWKN